MTLFLYALSLGSPKILGSVCVHFLVVRVSPAGVMRYLSDFVRQTFIPYLSGQTNTRLRKILEDKDALAPLQTDRKASMKQPNKGKRLWSEEQCLNSNLF